MSTPLEICLEELFRAPEDEERFVRCVALPGGEPGLELDREGAVQWMPDAPADYGLWVSEDGRLALLRGEGAAPIVVERGGRSLEAPVGQPVILIDQDLLRIGERRLRVHVHGETEDVYAPERLSRSALGRLVRAAAAAATVALGGAAVGAAGAPGTSSAQPQSAAGRPDVIEVRVRPPSRPRRYPVLCNINRQKPRPNQPLLIHATCPKPRGLMVGNYGYILDPKTGAIVNRGRVVVESISGTKIVAKALRRLKPVQAKQLRFYSPY